MAKNRLLARVFLGSLNCFPGFFRHDFAVMPVKKVSVNWTAKLRDSKDLPKYGDSGDGKFSKKFGEGRYHIPAPIEVDALMKKVPRGRLTTINDLRAALSKKHKTDFACPITTGIFSWIAAHAADEMARQGRKRITPYWRTLKSDGQINPKYLGGAEAIREKLEAEGHSVIQKGKRFLVKDFEKKTVGPKLK